MSTLHTAQLDYGDYSFTFDPHRLPLSGDNKESESGVVADEFPANMVGETEEVEAEELETLAQH